LAGVAVGMALGTAFFQHTFAQQGSVISNTPGAFTITNTIDLSKYVTVYTLDTEGRIAKSVISSDDEPLGEITYTYSVTKEGKAALAGL